MRRWLEESGLHLVLTSL